jgi:hypothetical protein
MEAQDGLDDHENTKDTIMIYNPARKDSFVAHAKKELLVLSVNFAKKCGFDQNDTVCNLVLAINKEFGELSEHIQFLSE